MSYFEMYLALGLAFNVMCTLLARGETKPAIVLVAWLLGLFLWPVLLPLILIRRITEE